MLLLLIMLTKGDSLVFAQTNAPNIIVLMADDMAWAGTSFQFDPDIPESASDYHQTPRIEELATRGTAFTNAYAAGPMCSPTRAALMTGIGPAQFQVTDVRQASDTSNGRFTGYYTGYPLTPPQPKGTTFTEELTIADDVHALGAGYKTSFYGKYDWWPHPRDAGFDEYLFNGYTSSADPAGTFTMTAKALDFIDRKVQSNQPFFTTISYDAPKDFDALPETIAKYQALPPGERHYNPYYAAAHEDLDTAVGMVMDRIDQLGISDNTYIIFTSDHGAPSALPQTLRANEPLFGGKGTIWEGGVRVPLIIAGPEIPGGVRSEVPVTTVDLFSTIYDAAGGLGAPDSRVEGVSLLPLLENGGDLPEGQQSLIRNHAPNGELYFHFPHYSGTLPSGRTRPTSAVRDGDYKLVRVYGENGEPDELLLFDLAASPLESSDPLSPLNLASSMPDKVQELNNKLSTWLQDVDASLPYDVRTPIQLDWILSQNTSGNETWRSLQDVDQLDRETWKNYGFPETNTTRVAIDAHQPGLGDLALEFAGGQRLVRRYLHVSDSEHPDTIDGDHSVSLEFWVQLDSLSGEQILLDAGNSTQGLSLTLGDADGDSVANDLRFRVLGKEGQHMTVTAPVDKFADPTSDFIQVAAVVNDASDARYVELYVNGSLVGRVDGTLGATGIDWDSFDLASLGNANREDNTIGGDGGDGDRPFINGGLVGRIAAIRFQNYAITPADVLDAYNEKLSPVSLGIAMASGDAVKVVQRPSSVAAGMLEHNDHAMVMLERQDTLDDDLDVELLSTTNSSGTLAEGTDYASYLVHFDPVGSTAGLQSVMGTITFASEVLGVIWAGETLASTDAVLGTIGEYDLGSREGDFAGSDFITLSADHRTLSFMLSAEGDAIAQLRVLTTPTMAGDFNGDGVVNLADYTVWRNNLGAGDESGINWGGDGAGGVDYADYALWKYSFGASSGSEFAAASVPEPSSCMLALSILVGTIYYSRGCGRKSPRFSR